MSSYGYCQASGVSGYGCSGRQFQEEDMDGQYGGHRGVSYIPFTKT